MTAIQHRIHTSLETRDSYSQASREGAALRGELGKDAQLLALSELYKELKAAGKMEQAAAVKEMALAIYNQQ